MLLFASCDIVTLAKYFISDISLIIFLAQDYFGLIKIPQPECLDQINLIGIL